MRIIINRTNRGNNIASVSLLTKPCEVITKRKLMLAIMVGISNLAKELYDIGFSDLGSGYEDDWSHTIDDQGICFLFTEVLDHLYEDHDVSDLKEYLDTFMYNVVRDNHQHFSDNHDYPIEGSIKRWNWIGACKWVGKEGRKRLHLINLIIKYIHKYPHCITE